LPRVGVWLVGVQGSLASSVAPSQDVEPLVGRDSLWWGPGLHGSLILANNTPPLDQVRIGAAEPFILPWIGQWVGPTKLLFFLAQIEHYPQDPHTKLAGMRATIAPFSFLELGISRTLQFDGDNRPRLDLEGYPRDIFFPAAGDDRIRQPQFRNNNLFAIDGDLRLRNVRRVRVGRHLLRQQLHPAPRRDLPASASRGSRDRSVRPG